MFEKNSKKLCFIRVFNGIYLINSSMVEILKYHFHAFLSHEKRKPSFLGSPDGLLDPFFAESLLIIARQEAHCFQVPA